MTKEANADIKTAFDEFQKVVKKNGGKLSTTMGTFVTTCGKNGELGIKEMTKKIKIASSSKTAKKNINGAVTGLAATVKSGTKKFETAGTALGAAVAKGITKELGKAKISKTVSIGTNNSVSNLDIQNMVNSAVKSGVQSELKKLNLKIMLDDEVVGSLIRGEVKEALR